MVRLRARHIISTSISRRRATHLVSASDTIASIQRGLPHRARARRSTGRAVGDVVDPGCLRWSSSSVHLHARRAPARPDRRRCGESGDTDWSAELGCRYFPREQVPPYSSPWTFLISAFRDARYFQFCNCNVMHWRQPMQRNFTLRTATRALDTFNVHVVTNKMTVRKETSYVDEQVSLFANKPWYHSSRRGCPHSREVKGRHIHTAICSGWKMP